MAKKGWKRPPMTRERLKNQFLNLIGNPFNVIVLITLLILFVFIVIPLLTMVQNTFVVTRGSLRFVQRLYPNAQIGDYTLFSWRYLFGPEAFDSAGKGFQYTTNYSELFILWSIL